VYSGATLRFDFVARHFKLVDDHRDLWSLRLDDMSLIFGIKSRDIMYVLGDKT